MDGSREMAPLGDDVLTMIGWTIAGSITLAGVLFASWLKDRRQNYDRDLIEIYEPIYPILCDSHQSGMKEYHRPEGSGSSYHAYGINTFLSSGRLFPKRFAELKEDLEKMIGLAEKTACEERDLIELVKRKLNAQVEGLKGDSVTSKELNPALFSNLQNGLLYPLLIADRGDLFDMIDKVKKDTATDGNKELFGKKATELYDRVNPEIDERRRVYRRCVFGFLRHNVMVKNGIEKSLGKKGKKYKRGRLAENVETMDEFGVSQSPILDDRRIRTRTLTMIYELHQQNPNDSVDMAEIGKNLGFHREDVLRSVKYLSDKGYAKVTWTAGKMHFRDARISATGADEIEKNEMKGV